MGIKSSFSMIKETFKEWMEDRAPLQAAAMAFYTIFSLAPLLLIIISVAGLVFGREAAQGALVGQLRGLLGDQGAEMIQTMIANAHKSGASIITTIIGIVTLLLGASGVFGHLQEMLNTIWDVKPAPNRGIMGAIRSRFLSFSMVLGVGFLLVVSLVLSAALAALTQYLGTILPGADALWHAVNFVVSFLVITLLFAMIFKVLPEAKVAWRYVWLGAVVTALLFTAGKFLLGLYLGQSAVGSTFGAAGSLIIILLWIYYSAQILFLGAEFTQVYARRRGAGIRPAEGAVPA